MKPPRCNRTDDHHDSRFCCWCDLLVPSWGRHEVELSRRGWHVSCPMCLNHTFGAKVAALLRRLTRVPELHKP